MLFPIYHVIASFYPVATGTTIEKGQVLAFDDAAGTVVLCDGTTNPIGLAGDEVGTLSAGTFVNRVSDYGNDTYASGLITVYHGGGEFYVDIGDVVSSGTTITLGGLLSCTAGGKMTNAASDHALFGASGKKLVARITDTLAGTNGRLPTGIPGEFEPSGNHDDSVSSATKFVRIQLLI